MDMAKKTRVMSDEEVAAARLRAEAYAQGSEVKPEDVSAPSTSELKYGMGAFPGVMWANDFSWSFGSLRTICVSAWIVFLLLPTLFFTLVQPCRIHCISLHLSADSIPCSPTRSLCRRCRRNCRIT